MIKKILKNNQGLILVILTLTFSRLIPHPPNFTPIISLALISGYIFRNIFFSLVVLLISMLITDFLLKFHDTMIFVYLSLCLICFFSFKKIKRLNYKNIFIFSIIGSFLFFLITNFGFWLMGDLYTKNINGLISCYFLALPFFTNTLLSTIFFSFLSCFIINLNFIKKNNFKIKI
jgi:hypothetical protein